MKELPLNWVSNLSSSSVASAGPRPRQHDTRCLHYELLAISQTEVLQDPLVHDHGAISQLRLQARPARHPPTQQDSAIDSNA